MSNGGAPTPAGTLVFTKHNWDMGMGHLYGLMGEGRAFMTSWVGHLSLDGQGAYHLMGRVLIT